MNFIITEYEVIGLDTAMAQLRLLSALLDGASRPGDSLSCLCQPSDMAEALFAVSKGLLELGETLRERAKYASMERPLPDHLAWMYALRIASGQMQKTPNGVENDLMRYLYMMCQSNPDFEFVTKELIGIMGSQACPEAVGNGAVPESNPKRAKQPRRLATTTA